MFYLPDCQKKQSSYNLTAQDQTYYDKYDIKYN